MILSKLGVQVRKIGSIEDLYKEVDMVLSKPMDTMIMQTVAHGLQQMFNPNKHLDVCFIRTASSLAGVIIPQEKMDMYHILHCMSWSEMEVEFRTNIMCMILDDFRPALKATDATNKD
jgi:hypothetical protein